MLDYNTLNEKVERQNKINSDTSKEINDIKDSMPHLYKLCLKLHRLESSSFSISVSYFNIYYSKPTITLDEFLDIIYTFTGELFYTSNQKVYSLYSYRATTKELTIIQVDNASYKYVNVTERTELEIAETYQVF